MNQEIKQKWVTALRSGNYKQTKTMLHAASGYCCLGVLCDIIDPSKWVEKDGDTMAWYSYEGWVGLLPQSIQEAANIPSNGVLKEEVSFNGKTHYNLVSLNDAGMDFLGIADVIEKQF